MLSRPAIAWITRAKPLTEKNALHSSVSKPIEKVGVLNPIKKTRRESAFFIRAAGGICSEMSQIPFPEREYIESDGEKFLVIQNISSVE